MHPNLFLFLCISLIFRAQSMTHAQTHETGQEQSVNNSAQMPEELRFIVMQNKFLNSNNMLQVVTSLELVEKDNTTKVLITEDEYYAIQPTFAKPTSLEPADEDIVNDQRTFIHTSSSYNVAEVLGKMDKNSEVYQKLLQLYAIAKNQLNIYTQMSQLIISAEDLQNPIAFSFTYSMHSNIPEDSSASTSADIETETSNI